MLGVPLQLCPPHSAAQLTFLSRDACWFLPQSPEWQILAYYMDNEHLHLQPKSEGTLLCAHEILSGAKRPGSTCVRLST